MTNYMDNIDPNLPLYDQLVGEGRPFADNEAFARSKLEGNMTIQQREDELARMRADLETRMNYEEFLEQFREKAPINVDNQPRQPATNPQTTPTLQDIERIVEQREQRKTYESNLNTALTRHAEVNGPNSALKLKQQATDLGMSEQALKGMAADNPKAFYKLTGISEIRQMNNFEAPPRTQVNTESFLPVSQTSKEAQAFKDLYKSDPSKYWSPAIQNQIHKAVAEGRVDPGDVM